MNKEIILINPYDAHGHWRRKNGLLYYVAPFSVNQFSGIHLMPNTEPRISTLKNLIGYRQEVDDFLDFNQTKNFLPTFTYYLTPELSEEDIVTAWNEKLINGIKYYPKGATTGSDTGLGGFYEVRKQLEIIQKHKIPFSVHSETPELDDEVVGDFKREKLFLNADMIPLRKEMPELIIVMEHITIKDSADFVLAHENTWATITPQGCLLDDRALFNKTTTRNRKVAYSLKPGGMFPSMMCRPIIKDIAELSGIQLALKFQALNGLKKFGLGTDTAPHDHEAKYCEGCACGIFTAPIALQLYAMAFEQIGILNHLPIFACDVMPELYGIKDKLPYKKVILTPEGQEVKPDYNGIVIPFAGQMIPWGIKN